MAPESDAGINSSEFSYLFKAVKLLLWHWVKFEGPLLVLLGRKKVFEVLVTEFRCVCKLSVCSALSYSLSFCGGPKAWGLWVDSQQLECHRYSEVFRPH